MTILSSRQMQPCFTRISLHIGECRDLCLSVWLCPSLVRNPERLSILRSSLSKLQEIFFATILFTVSVNLWYYAVASKPVDRILALFVPGVVLVRELKENVPRDLVRVVVFDDFPRGIIHGDMFKFNFVWWIAKD